MSQYESSLVTRMALQYVLPGIMISFYTCTLLLIVYCSHFQSQGLVFCVGFQDFSVFLLGSQPWALHMLGKYPATEPHLQAFLLLFCQGLTKLPTLFLNLPFCCLGLLSSRDKQASSWD